MLRFVLNRIPVKKVLRLDCRNQHYWQDFYKKFRLYNLECSYIQNWLNKHTLNSIHQLWTPLTLYIYFFYFLDITIHNDSAQRWPWTLPQSTVDLGGSSHQYDTSLVVYHCLIEWFGLLSQDTLGKGRPTTGYVSHGDYIGKLVAHTVYCHWLLPSVTVVSSLITFRWAWPLIATSFSSLMVHLHWMQLHLPAPLFLS